MPTSYRSRKTTDKKSKTGRKSRKGAATAESKDREQPHCPIFFVEYGPGRKSLFNSACRCNTLLDTVKDICTKALQTAIEARRAEIAGGYGCWDSKAVRVDSVQRRRKISN
eukprot:903768-Amorphochlora_amoeboformis.AAC.2